MSDESSFVPFHRPAIGEQDIEAVRRVLESRWLTTGPVAANFERAFAEYVGCRYALAVNSCTAALQLALDAIGLSSGDEVLVPTYTFTATAEVVAYFHARPVLCDSLPGGFNIDPHDVERRITPRTRAIIPVHVAGQPCDLRALHGIANKIGVPVIEDAAHALPAEHRGRRIGGISDLTAFSFYATKAITTGEGGMLTTDSEAYAKRADMMRLHGIGNHDAWKRYSREGSWFYSVFHAGYKLNMPDILAAIGLAQLQRCDEFWQCRRAIAQYYMEQLAGCDELELPPDDASCSKHSWHLFILRTRPKRLKMRRQEFMDELKQLGICTSVHFIPLHFHPFYSETYGYKQGDFPNAEDSYSRAISLPIYPDLKASEMERVVKAVRSIVSRKRKTILASAS